MGNPTLKSTCSCGASSSPSMPFTIKESQIFQKCRYRSRLSLCLLRVRPCHGGLGEKQSMWPVSCFSLLSVGGPTGAVWLFWDNLLITIQYGPLERQQWNVLFLPCVSVNELITWPKTGFSFYVHICFVNFTEVCYLTFLHKKWNV